MSAHFRFFSLLMLGGTAALAAPGAERLPDHPAPDALAGELHLMGADVMDSLAVAWLEVFRQAHPQAEATQEARSANSAFPGLLSGACQLGMLSRDAYAEEVAAFTKKFGYPPTVIRVGLGTYDVFGLSPPLVIFVHQDNPLREITLAQLEEIYARDGRITTWGQLGLPGEWADRPIAVWGLRLPNGTATYFQTAAMHGREFRPTMIRRPAVSGLSRSAQRAPNGGVQAFVDILAEVARDRFALGYAAPGYPQAGTRMLAVAPAPGVPAINPTRENVASLRYPLVRFIYFYLNRPPGKPIDANVREFLRLALSPQGQALVAQRSGFLPLPTRIVAEELAKLD